MVLTLPWGTRCYRCLYVDDVEPERNRRVPPVSSQSVVGVMGTSVALARLNYLQRDGNRRAASYASLTVN